MDWRGQRRNLQVLRLTLGYIPHTLAYVQIDQCRVIDFQPSPSNGIVKPPSIQNNLKEKEKDEDEEGTLAYSSFPIIDVVFAVFHVDCAN